MRMGGSSRIWGRVAANSPRRPRPPQGEGREASGAARVGLLQRGDGDGDVRVLVCVETGPIVGCLGCFFRVLDPQRPSFYICPSTGEGQAQAGEPPPAGSVRVFLSTPPPLRKKLYIDSTGV